MNSAPAVFDPGLAVVGSILFVAVPLYYLAFLLSRKLGGQSHELKTVAGSLGIGLAWFSLFLFWRGPDQGIYTSVPALFGWCLGFFQASRRNEVKRRFYYTAGAKRAQKAASQPAKDAPKRSSRNRTDSE
ncbi:MAG: hypothetical protein OHK0029_32180 [Armatimonadaceae bacterium]